MDRHRPVSATLKTTPQDRHSIRRWGEALKAKNNPLGESLLAYADAWDADIARMEQELEDCCESASYHYTSSAYNDY